MRARHLLLLTPLALLVALITGCQTGVSIPPRIEAELDRAIAHLSEDEPGCAVAVYDDHQIVWAAQLGRANLEEKAPITDTTIFDIASTSKQFTATAILLLEQQGKISLDDAVAEYLPGLPPWAEEVTLKQLVQHTSGIPDVLTLLDFPWDQPVSQDDMLAAIAAVPELLVEPGTKFGYTNSGYVLLALVVEAVDGRTLPEFLKSEVFAKAGMKAVMDPFLESPDRATGYLLEKDEYKPFVVRMDLAGLGGVQTTASELARWGGQYWDPTVGGEDLLTARTDDAFGTSRFGYGAGIGIDGSAQDGPRLGHPGGIPGFSSDLEILPDRRVAAAVTCNNDVMTDPRIIAINLLNAYESES